jgi:hypothetical protein
VVSIRKGLLCGAEDTATAAKWKVAEPENPHNGTAQKGGFVIEKLHELRIKMGWHGQCLWLARGFMP